MSDMTNVDLAFLANMLVKIDGRMAAMEGRMDTYQDDMAVLTAICQRMDGIVGNLLTEVRAMHSQHTRLANRVRNLENTAT